jgi:hypothetical protein
MVMLVMMLGRAMLKISRSMRMVFVFVGLRGDLPMV